MSVASPLALPAASGSPTAEAAAINMSSPPIVVAVATTKGGSGKSDLALNLAVAAHQDGMRTAIVDLDPQGTLISWGAGVSGYLTPI